jgi:hypothetical protein
VPQFEEETRAAVKAVVSGTNDPPQEIHRVTVGLFLDQFENWERALETARQISGSDKTGNCLDLICTEFNAQYAGKHPPKSQALKRYIAMIERAFGVRIIALNPDSDEILAGKDTAKELGVK